MEALSQTSADTEDLLALGSPGGQNRRLTMLFIDVVDSTALSCRVEPETYWTVVGSYRRLVLNAAHELGGYIGFTKGDGLLVIFGHPVTHDNDVHRAVAMGMRVTAEVARLSAQVNRRFGFPIAVRIAIHRGMVYLDTERDEAYGGAVSLTQWMAGRAEPGTVVVSDAVASLVGSQFELRGGTADYVKNTESMIGYHRVLRERDPRGTGERGPLVGRDRPRARLARCWQRAQAHRLDVPGVMFRGGPGLGKSRLAAAAEDLARNSGKPVLRLSGSPLPTAACLHPVRGLVDEAALPQHPDDVSPATVDSIRDRVLAHFGNGAGVLIVEDVHWFDPATLRVLDAVLSHSRGRLLVVMTSRTGLSLPGTWPVKVLDLQPMTETEADALVKILAPELPEPLRIAVRERSDGVPLYIEQIVAEIARIGTDPGIETPMAVPDALYDALLTDLDVSAPALPVLQAAAVIGRHVDRRVLCATLDLSDDELDDVVDELEERDILTPWGLDGWRFRRELIREMATELAPPSVLRELNSRLAEFLGQTAADATDWQRVGTHFERAELLDAAAAAFQRASDCERSIA